MNPRKYIKPVVLLPKNDVLPHEGTCNLVNLLRTYKDCPEAIQFIADMLEE